MRPLPRTGPSAGEDDSTARRQPRRGAGIQRHDQRTLDFLPQAPQSPRTTKTNVESAIFCDAPVATPLHRMVSAGLDLGVVFVGYLLFLAVSFAIVSRWGGGVDFSRNSLLVYGACFVALLFLYGALWVLANRETAGMRWAQLELINFDGDPPDRGQRLLRFGGMCIGLPSLGLGVLWTLVDEESLGWHDHMSKTYPTIREPNRKPSRDGGGQASAGVAVRRPQSGNRAASAPATSRVR